MLFNSLTFILFFAVVFSLHALLRRAPNARKNLLLIASYIFYAAWNPPYVLILIFSTTLDWWLARKIWLSTSDAKRKRLLVVSIAANLSLLAFFKYGAFLLANFQLALSAVGITYSPPLFDVILPIGISFYTFASLSYTIDVYRREISGDWHWRDYALFVAFFPHLVAGPIVRARLLLPQIVTPREPTRDQVGWGMTLLCIGLFTKTVLADSVFRPIVDQVYANPARFGAIDTWAAVLGFSGQIYYDFSGYSLCAIGLALCFGFEFPDNFRFPYAARGFSDFWRRWHISLSSWLRDYLYIPLGGNRRGGSRTYRNLMLIMLLGGLWHGASWTFVFWGGLHGMWLALERKVGAGLPIKAPRAAAAIALMCATFLVVTLTWIPFRSNDVGTMTTILSGLARFGTGSVLPMPALACCFAAIVVTLTWQMTYRDSSIEQVFAKLGSIPAVAFLATCLVGIFLCSGAGQHAFIYFQF